MRLNHSSLYPNTHVTHEGTPAKHISVLDQLRRSVLSCFLWEKEFYEDGETIAVRIDSLVANLVNQKAGGDLAAAQIVSLIEETRSAHNLRHVSLLLACSLSKHFSGSKIVQDGVYNAIRRADELTEILTIYANINDVHPSALKPKLSNAMRKGISRALLRFDEYQLSKYNRYSKGDPVKLRDVIRLCHPKPDSDARKELWEKVLKDTLPVADTWENELIARADKKATFERLIRENNLGYLALLRNLRNMEQAGCDRALVKQAILDRKNGADKVLPFRFIAASRAAPSFEPELDVALQANIQKLPVLKGKTFVMVDVSGSMDAKLSDKSDLTRLDAAAALASIVNCEDLRVFSFSDRVVEVAPRRGVAGVDAISRSQSHQGTHLGLAVKTLNTMPHDRLIVITDEQSHDPVGNPVAEKAYMINVASNKRGVGYGAWTHIDGFSENIIRYISESEAMEG